MFTAVTLRPPAPAAAHEGFVRSASQKEKEPGEGTVAAAQHQQPATVTDKHTVAGVGDIKSVPSTYNRSTHRQLIHVSCNEEDYMNEENKTSRLPKGLRWSAWADAYRPVFMIDNASQLDTATTRCQFDYSISAN